MIAVLYALLGIIGGLILAGFFALGWFLLKEIRALRQMLESLGASQIGSALRWLPELTNSIKLLVEQNSAMTGALETIARAPAEVPVPAVSPAAREAADMEIARRRQVQQPRPTSEEHDEQIQETGAEDGERETVY